MFDARKIIIIFVIGVLYAIFSYSVVDAIYPSQEYSDFCNEFERAMPIRAPTPGENFECPEPEKLQCEKGAMPMYEYDAHGCPINVTCDYCQRDYENAQQQRNLFVFIITSILGLLAISVGLFLPQKKHPMHEWVATGFMLGGLITLFIGTAIYYADMARIARPIVMFFELALVVYLAYKKLKK